MMASGGLSDQSMDYGLPPRPPTASTAVWKHLLRTTTTSQAPKSLKDVPIIAPPMAPLDKNATSMRVLLHDTQANFERFATQAGKLFDTTQETKNELKTMQSLFQRDRETLTGDIVDLVNRSQREIQKSIGTPTQSDAFENLCKNINHRLDGIDQKLEAMNAFNQTHSQALQTQMHTVQLILDKQGSILSAVTPVLPFLQGIPPLIEALRTILTEKLQELSTSLQNHARSPTSPITTKKRKRSFIGHDSTSVSPSSDNTIKSPGLPQKKSRIMDLSEAQPSTDATPRVTDAGQGTSTPLFFASSSSPLPPILTSIETSSGTAATLQLHEKQPSTTQNPTTLRQHPNNFAVPPLPPPASRSRLSAADLTVSGAEHVFGSVTSAAPLWSGLSVVRSRTNVSAHVAAPTPQRQPSIPSFFGITPTATRPPRMLRVHASIAARSRSNSVVSAAESQAASNSVGNTLKNLDLVDPKRDHPKPSKMQINPAQAQGGGKVSASKSAAREATPVISRITRSNTRAFASLALPQPPHSSVKEEKEFDLKSKLITTLTLPQPSIKDEKEAVVHDVKNRLPPVTPSVAALKGKNIIRPPVPGSSKERRSPLREGRRFIPIMDSDDEEENR